MTNQQLNGIEEAIANMKRCLHRGEKLEALNWLAYVTELVGQAQSELICGMVEEQRGKDENTRQA